MNFYAMDTLDWREVKIDWDAITEDIIKAGTPMSREGKAANDGSCYGILMDDVQRKRNKKGRVMISGRLDFAQAEAHSGIALSDEAKAALPDVWDQGGSGGVSSWNDLTDKPFYKSEETILDGTFEFVDAGGEMSGMYLHQIGDADFSLSDGQSYTVVWDGKEYQCTAAIIMGEVLMGNLGLAGMADTGEPFCFMSFNGVCAAGTFDTAANHTVKVSTETIKTIDPEFLPAKGTFVVNLFHSYENGTWTSDKTAEEIVKAVRRGEAVQCVETNDDGINGAIWQLQSVNDYVDISSMEPEYTPRYVATFNRFEVFEGNGRCQYLSINHDGTIYASNQKIFDIFDDK